MTTTTAKGTALVTGAASGIGTISAKGVRPQGWTTAFAEQSEKSFADTLAEDVTLEASGLAPPIVGRNRVKHVMGVGSKIYEAIAFTHQAESGARTYLEWQAKAFGGESLAGVTVLTKDEKGLIVHAAIHHRPLAALLRFSAELRERLRGTIEPDHFFSGK